MRPLPWSAPPSSASSGRLCSSGTLSTAYFDHHDAVWYTASCCCARMSAPALICRLAKDSVSHMVKIGNGVSRNMNLEFLHASTTVIASPHHHLITSARSAPHLALHSSRTKLRQARPQASSSAFGARVLTFPVDPKPLVLFVNCLGCVDRACSSLHSIRQFTSRSEGLQCANTSSRRDAARGSPEPEPRTRDGRPESSRVSAKFNGRKITKL